MLLQEGTNPEDRILHCFRTSVKKKKSPSGQSLWRGWLHRKVSSIRELVTAFRHEWASIQQPVDNTVSQSNYSAAIHKTRTFFFIFTFSRLLKVGSPLRLHLIQLHQQLHVQVCLYLYKCFSVLWALAMSHSHSWKCAIQRLHSSLLSAVSVPGGCNLQSCPNSPGYTARSLYLYEQLSHLSI